MAIHYMASFGGWTAAANATPQNVARGWSNYTAANTLAVVTDPTLGKVLGLGATAALETLVPTGLPDQATTFSFGIAFSTARTDRLTDLVFTDANNVTLTVRIDLTSLSVTYNPAGTANDINLTVPRPALGGFHVLEVSWSPSSFKLFFNNKEIVSVPWTGVAARFTRFYRSYLNGPNFDIYWMYIADERLGMLQAVTPTLAAPSADTSASVTGAANRQTALASFDGDTSYVTYTEGSGQLTDLPLTATLPASSTIHAIKVTGQAAGAGGVANGRIRLGAPAGVANAVPLAMGLTYSPTTQVYHSDINVDPFDVADLNAGNITVGIEEGA